MPRTARLDVPEVLQHVMARGIERREIFREDRDREEFRGGGLVRSAGGREKLLQRGADEREQGDERVLGSGDFVERLLARANRGRPTRPKDVGIFLAEVSAQWGVSTEQLLGRSRERRLTAARQEFVRRAHDEGCVPLATLARQLGLAHTSVSEALQRAREANDAQ